MAFLLFLSLAVVDAQQGYIGDYKGAPGDKVKATTDMTAVIASKKCLTELDYTKKSYQCDQFGCVMEGWEEKKTFDYFWFNKKGCESNKKSFQENQGCEIDCDKYDKYAPTEEGDADAVATVESDEEPCSTFGCTNGSECIYKEGAPICECKDGFGGQQCEIEFTLIDEVDEPQAPILVIPKARVPKKSTTTTTKPVETVSAAAITTAEPTMTTAEPTKSLKSVKETIEDTLESVNSNSNSNSKSNKVNDDKKSDEDKSDDDKKSDEDKSDDDKEGHKNEADGALGKSGASCPKRAFYPAVVAAAASINFF